MTLAVYLRQNRLLLVLPFLLLAVVYAPVFPGMFRVWMDDPNYSHGFLVPPIAAWFAWKSWPELRERPVEPSAAGFLLILAGMALLAGGLAIAELYTSRVSFIVILAGLVQVFFGTAGLRVLALPIAFLFFMVPLPYPL